MVSLVKRFEKLIEDARTLRSDIKKATNEELREMTDNECIIVMAAKTKNTDALGFDCGEKERLNHLRVGMYKVWMFDKKAQQGRKI